MASGALSYAAHTDFDTNRANDKGPPEKTSFRGVGLDIGGKESSAQRV